MHIQIPVLCTTALLWASLANAQYGWQPHSVNPVLTAGGTTWDAAAVGQPSCTYDNGRFRMWYTGAAADLRGRILLAESPDGVSWTRLPTPVLEVGADGTWDGWTLDTPAVVCAAESYFLYYFGQRDPGSAEGSSIGVATSSDGLAFQRVGPDPVLEPGPPGSWDARWVESPTVVFDSRTGRWLMWYTGLSAEWRASIGLATSDDGIHWQKYPANPILGPGLDGSWNDYWIAVPTVMVYRSGYWLFYSGVSAEDLGDGRVDDAAVGFAWSIDGDTWLGVHSSPVLTRDDAGPGGSWAPTVVLGPEGNQIFMWFETETGIGFATATTPERRRSGIGTRSVVVPGTALN